MAIVICIKIIKQVFKNILNLCTKDGLTLKFLLKFIKYIILSTGKTVNYTYLNLIAKIFLSQNSISKIYFGLYILKLILGIS